MGIFDFFKKKKPKQQPEPYNFSPTINFGNRELSPKEQIKERTGIDLDYEKYVCLSTSGDENVCPMCAQFDGNSF